WGVRQVTDQLVVVNADHRDFVRNTHAELAAGVEYLTAANVVTRHDTDRFWKAADPVANVCAFPLPRGSARWLLGWPVDTAFESLSGNLPLKVLRPPVGPVETRVARITELPEPPLQHVLGGQAGDRGVIRFDIEQVRNVPSRAHVDGWQFRGDHGLGDCPVLDTNDDAVTAPFPEPVGHRFAAA